MFLKKFLWNMVYWEVSRFIGNENIKTNIFRIQKNNSIMCG